MKHKETREHKCLRQKIVFFRCKKIDNNKSIRKQGRRQEGADFFFFFFFYIYSFLSVFFCASFFFYYYLSIFLRLTKTTIKKMSKALVFCRIGEYIFLDCSNLSTSPAVVHSFFVWGIDESDDDPHKCFAH